MMRCLLVLFLPLFVSWTIYLTVLSVTKVSRMLLSYRYAILDKPSRFRKQWCQNRTEGFKKGFDYEGLSKFCRLDIYWRTDQNWVFLCQEGPKKTRFPRRYYRLKAQCRPVYKTLALSVFSIDWLIYR